MNATLDASLRYDKTMQQQLGSLAEHPAWLTQLKQNARESFLQQGFPNRKQEAWRYTSLDKLLQHDFVPAQKKTKPATLRDLDTQFIPDLDTYRLVFQDNHFCEALSAIDGLPSGVHIQSMQQLWSHQPHVLKPWLASSAVQHNNSFTALNTALMNDGIFIHLDKGIELDKPIELLFHVSSHDDTVTHTPRVLIVLAEGAKASLIERYCGSSQRSYFQNVVEEIVLEPDAALTHYRLIEEQSQAYHLSTIAVNQQKNSYYKNLNFEFTGTWLRTDFEIDLNGQSAQCELNGLYVVDHAQQADVHINMKHHAPDCHSKQHYKGLLLGKGRAIFDGKILVDQAAQLTDAQMTNDNLILSEGAEVDTKPQLEIYADNVKCSHGTTVGQLDPEQLFYLRSRGIAKDVAFRMLCQGYIEEVLISCDLEPLRQFIETQFIKTLTWDQ